MIIPTLSSVIIRIRGANKTEHTLKGRTVEEMFDCNSLYISTWALRYFKIIIYVSLESCE